MITTHVASANAHTMCHHSVEYSGVFYMFDYFGITIYLYLSGISTFVYSYPLDSNQDLMTITLVSATNRWETRVKVLESYINTCLLNIKKQ